MYKQKIAKIRKMVKNMVEKDDWKFHILPVVKWTKRLAKLLKVDEEVAELAALLHDIGRIKYGGENHHITGAKEAEKILRKYKFPESIISEVKHCVLSHRSATDIKPKTKLAKIIANADVMAHFDNFPVLIFFGASRNFSFKETIEWVEKKIEKDWNKKLTLPQARKLMRKKYQAIKLILESTKEYF